MPYSTYKSFRFKKVANVPKYLLKPRLSDVLQKARNMARWDGDRARFVREAMRKATAGRLPHQVVTEKVLTPSEQRKFVPKQIRMARHRYQEPILKPFPELMALSRDNPWKVPADVKVMWDLNKKMVDRKAVDNKVLFPEFNMYPVRPDPHMKKFKRGQILFYIPLKMTKLDCLNYLQRIYNVKAAQVNTDVVMLKDGRHTADGRIWSKLQKRAFVTLEKGQWHYPKVYREMDRDAATEGILGDQDPFRMGVSDKDKAKGGEEEEEEKASSRSGNKKNKGKDTKGRGSSGEAKLIAAKGEGDGEPVKPAEGDSWMNLFKKRFKR